MKAGSPWAWGASGKHPVVKDFIMIGTETPLLRTLSRWVEEGFARVGASADLHSWRFFARPGRSGGLSCGLVRDSRDNAGRPFPLLVVGSGTLAGWERSWERLPAAFDQIWSRIEFMCAKRAHDLAELKSDLDALPAPALDCGSPRCTAPREGAGPRLSSGGMCTVPLAGGEDHIAEVVRKLAGMREGSGITPDAVFIGGTRERSFLVAFARALSSEDFVSLWSMGGQDA